MEDYAEELRTPPVSLISLVGCPDLHQSILTYLHKQQPPINTIALPDFSAISLLQKTKKETLDSAVPGGILKRDWLSKHRTRVPVVVAALFGSAAVSGDPAQWLQLCTDLENLNTLPIADMFYFLLSLLPFVIQRSLNSKSSVIARQLYTFKVKLIDRTIRSGFLFLLFFSFLSQTPCISGVKAPVRFPLMAGGGREGTYSIGNDQGVQALRDLLPC
ncbi:hypothetical protein Sjap_009654 [Stephania japonica]|uniref:Uncharacterized protein n=1 Tax=Stephania japonica TaxID=461633 RepID=A0AAP0JA93_9MAGN